MELQDLLKLYEEKRKIFKDKAYLHISELFQEARGRFKREYLKSERALKKKAEGEEPDAEQAWKAFKGKNFEKLILSIIQQELNFDSIACIPGENLSREKLSSVLDKVHRNLIVRYGEYGLLPDADLVIYEKDTGKVIATISCKITLRERIAQTAYWKLKLASSPATMHVKGLFITTDEDGDLVKGINPENSKSSRNRIIVEHELDGTYALREVAESEKVKAFHKLIDDVKRFVNGCKNTRS